MKVRNIVLVAGLASSMFIVGCEEAKNTASQASTAVGDAAKKAGDTATKAVDATKEGMKDAAHATSDAAGKAVDATKDAAASATDAVSKALESAKTDTTKWLTDTVEKQWPGMKTQLDDAAKKVGGIKDPAIKTKAEGMVKELQASIPGIEETVTKIKNLDWKSIKMDDFSKMKDAATKAWDTFGSKLKELSGMLPK